jgi:inosine triphosphate pyrophosphatase
MFLKVKVKSTHGRNFVGGRSNLEKDAPRALPHNARMGPTFSSSSPRVVTLVTGNAGKLAEITRVISQNQSLANKVTLVSRALDLPELQGEPEAVAAEKARHAAKLLGPGHAVLVEDTSLCFNALHGLPGVYVKWFLDKTGLEGLIKLVVPYEDKTAYAQCIFALCDERGVVSTFVGRTEGRVVDKPRTSPEGKAFGWDPIFEPNEPGNKTFAEMTVDEKNKISHRGKALALVVEKLERDARATEGA